MIQQKHPFIRTTIPILACFVLQLIASCSTSSPTPADITTAFDSSLPDASASELDSYTPTSPPHSYVCGNSVVEQGEQCDDGNTIDTDTCTNDCQLRINGERSFFEPPPRTQSGDPPPILDPRTKCTDPNIRSGARYHPQTKVRYRIHLCQRDNGSDAYSEQDVRRLMDEIRVFYQQASVQFEEESLVRFKYSNCEPFYEDSSAFTKFIKAKTPTNVVPIVFVSKIPTKENPFPVGGYATQGDILVNGSLAHTVAIHELGHFFGLAHTHACNFGLETTMSCSSAGDFFCDTPPDRGPRGVNGLSKCTDGKTLNGSCDPYGCGIGKCDDGSRPDRDNMMSYYHCWPSKMSAEQADYVRCILDHELVRFLDPALCYKDCGGDCHPRGTEQNCGGCGIVCSTGLQCSIYIPHNSPSGPRAKCCDPKHATTVQGNATPCPACPAGTKWQATGYGGGYKFCECCAFDIPNSL